MDIPGYSWRESSQGTLPWTAKKMKRRVIHMQTKRIWYRSTHHGSPRSFKDLDTGEKVFIQQLTGKPLFGRINWWNSTHSIVNYCITIMLTKWKQINRTQHFLNYIATQEDVVLTYHAGDMVLIVYSDTGYNNMSRASCRVHGHYFLLINEDIPLPNK
jgi:hypothetical protein